MDVILTASDKSAPFISVAFFIVRNFISSNNFPRSPGRLCLKKMGLPSLNLTIAAKRAIGKASATNIAEATTVSRARFTGLCLGNKREENALILIGKDVVRAVF